MFLWVLWATLANYSNTRRGSWEPLMYSWSVRSTGDNLDLWFVCAGMEGEVSWDWALNLWDLMLSPGRKYQKWVTRLVVLENTQLVSELGFTKTALVHENMWLGKRKDERTGDEELLIPGWLCGHPWYREAAVPQSVTKGKSYQWNLEINPIPREFIHWLHKEIKTNKRKARYSIAWWEEDKSKQLLKTGVTV